MGRQICKVAETTVPKMLHKLIFNATEIGRQLFIEYYAYARCAAGRFECARKVLAALSQKLTRSRHRHHHHHRPRRRRRLIITGLIYVTRSVH